VEKEFYYTESEDAAALLALARLKALKGLYWRLSDLSGIMHHIDSPLRARPGVIAAAHELLG
jgi:hypothetical protein